MKLKPIKFAMRSTRLFRKYFYTFINILLVSFFVLGSVMTLISTVTWLNEKGDALKTNTEQVARLVSSICGDDPEEPLDASRKRIITSILISYSDVLDADFFLCNPRGEVVACREDVSDLASPALCTRHSTRRIPIVTAALAMTTNGHRSISDPGGVFGEQMLLSFDPFTVKGKPAGFVAAAQQVNRGILDYMKTLFRAFLLAGLTVLIIDFIGVYFISSKLVRPVGEMVKATRKYAKGDFSFRVEVREKDELGLLAESFNSMAVSLATLERSRRSFVANVSHELKTPMTTIGGFIDGMRDGTIPKKDHARYLDIVSGEVKRLARLVTGMLNLSRIEAGELELKRAAFDLSEMLFTTALSFERIIAEKRIELQGLDTLEAMPFYGDKDLLTQVFYNLIDNAVKFTPDGERIIISASRSKEEFRVAIKNTGVGIAPEEIARVFERFYKTDQSRSYDAKSAGLGLHLAQTIMHMHGGQIAAQSDGASYTSMAVTLPLGGIEN